MEENNQNREMIRIEKAVKKYKETVAINEIDYCFEQGKIYGIIGRNGSGKTVLMKCICGLTKLTSGRIVVNGLEVGKDVDFPANIGMIIEHPGFLPNYSGYENLKMLASYRNIAKKQEIRETMEKVGLSPDLKKWVSKYSLGMKQRLGIAQAIMERPEILLLDEPMNGLDNAGVEDIRNLLLELNRQGTTILLASHNREDIEILCDEVIEMDQGIIISCVKKEKSQLKK